LWSFGYLAYAATGGIKAVAERLGHTSTRMMGMAYVKVYADASVKVADAIDRLVRGQRRTRAGDGPCTPREHLTRDGPVYAAGPMQGHAPSRDWSVASDLRSPNGI
jgi:hypothetical protein